MGLLPCLITLQLIYKFSKALTYGYFYFPMILTTGTQTLNRTHSRQFSVKVRGGQEREEKRKEGKKTKFSAIYLDWFHPWSSPTSSFVRCHRFVVHDLGSFHSSHRYLSSRSPGFTLLVFHLVTSCHTLSRTSRLPQDVYDLEVTPPPRGVSVPRPRRRSRHRPGSSRSPVGTISRYHVVHRDPLLSWECPLWVRFTSVFPQTHSHRVPFLVFSFIG